jgi:ribonuclease HI
VKVNVDGAFDLETGRAGSGIVIRDSAGMAIFYASKAIFDGMNAEEVEALARLEGVRLALEWSRSKTIIVSDCLSVVLAACRPGVDKSQLAFILNDIKHVSRMLAR